MYFIGKCFTTKFRKITTKKKFQFKVDKINIRNDDASLSAKTTIPHQVSNHGANASVSDDTIGRVQINSWKSEYRPYFNFKPAQVPKRLCHMQHKIMMQV